MTEFFAPFHYFEYQKIVDMSAVFVKLGAQTSFEYDKNEIWEMYKNCKAAYEEINIYLHP